MASLPWRWPTGHSQDTSSALRFCVYCHSPYRLKGTARSKAQLLFPLGHVPRRYPQGGIIGRAESCHQPLSSCIPALGPEPFGVG